jgi:hypothetical protein
LPLAGAAQRLGENAHLDRNHDDGKLTSTRLYVEKDGIKPPM